MAEALREPRSPEMTRRELLDWIGRGSVLLLSAEVLAACGVHVPEGDDIGRPLDLSSGADASSVDQVEPADLGGPGDLGADLGTGSEDVVNPADAGADSGGGGFGFAPGSAGDDIFGPGTVRTVDRQDLAELLSNWELVVDGLVDEPMVFTFGDLIALSRQDQVTDFHCVEGWSVRDVPWNGVHLQTILDRVGAQQEVTHITFHTVGDVYNESLPLDIALEPKTLLAYGIAGETLPLNRGFPLRLVVPRLFGYKSAKFVYRLELTNQPINGFWGELRVHLRGRGGGEPAARGEVLGSVLGRCLRARARARARSGAVPSRPVHVHDHVHVHEPGASSSYRSVM